MNKEGREKEFSIEAFKRWKDFFTFIEETELPIWTPKGLMPYRPWAHQRRLIEMIMKEHYVIVLKSRQLGFTTTMAVFVAWASLMFPDWKAGIISKGQKEASAFLDRVKTSLNAYLRIPWIPDEFKPKYILNNRRQYILSIGSSVMSDSARADALRGESLHFLVIDEAAFSSDIRSFIQSALPTLIHPMMELKENNPLGYPWGIVIISTPNHLSHPSGKWFYEQWTKAVNGESEYKPFRVHWKDVKELPEGWYDTLKALINDEDQLAMEMELEFLTAGSFFSRRVVSHFQSIINQAPTIEYPRIKTKLGEEVLSYLEPVHIGDLVLGVDVATGIGEDFTAIVGIDLETGKQILEWKAHSPREHTAQLIEDLVSQLPVRMVVVERNSIGFELLEDLQALGTIPLYHHSDGKPGFPTTASTRPLLVGLMKRSLEDNPDLVSLPSLADELIHIQIKNSGKVEAGYGHHDDLVMAFALALKGREEMLRKGEVILTKRSKWAQPLIRIQREEEEDSKRWVPFSVRKKIEKESSKVHIPGFGEITF